MANTNNEEDVEKIRAAADDVREAGEEGGEALDKAADAKENIDEALDSDR